MVSSWGESVLGGAWIHAAGRSRIAVTAMHRSRLLLEQVLENQRAPGLAPRLHQRAALFELAEVPGRETESLGKVRDPRCGSFVVARQAHDAVAALPVRAGGQGACKQVIGALKRK